MLKRFDLFTQSCAVFDGYVQILLSFLQLHTDAHTLAVRCSIVYEYMYTLFNAVLIAHNYVCVRFYADPIYSDPIQ